jgi:hypothetical protein
MFCIFIISGILQKERRDEQGWGGERVTLIVSRRDSDRDGDREREGGNRGWRQSETNYERKGGDRGRGVERYKYINVG